METLGNKLQTCNFKAGEKIPGLYFLQTLFERQLFQIVLDVVTSSYTFGIQLIMNKKSHIPKVVVGLATVILFSSIGFHPAQATTSDPLTTFKANCQADKIVQKSTRDTTLNKNSGLPRTLLYSTHSGNFFCGEFINEMVELCAKNSNNALQYLINKQKEGKRFGKTKDYQWADKPINFAKSNCASFSATYGQLGSSKPPVTQSASKCGTVTGSFKEAATGFTWGKDSSTKLYKCGSWVPAAYGNSTPIYGWYNSEGTVNRMNQSSTQRNNWVTCWIAGGPNPVTKNNSSSQLNHNSIWYYTLGDQGSKWGWFASTFTSVGGEFEFPADVPSCYSITSAKLNTW